MKKYILAAIASVFVCGIAQAQTALETISTDSEIAASSRDLNTAKELSGRQIDGIMRSLKAGPVQMDGDIQPVEKEEIVLSEPQKLTLKGDVPSPSKPEAKSKEEKPGFFAHIGAAILAPITTPLAMTIVGAVGGAALGYAVGGPILAAVGGTLGAIGGLALGIVMIPISIVSNVCSGLSQLFKGNI
ncbi:MAG: hypothetical protein L6420_10490 [Elusimicrobia bacterium]|nr:hypothetical protein [Elusimicrobiota bacterium]